MSRSDTAIDVWSSLTWDDLEQWAGSRSLARGRAYQHQNRVEDLAVADDGQLLATVKGTERYVVTVRHIERPGAADSIRSECTCPVGENGCKHAVATVVALLDALAENADLPIADTDDPRWDILAGRIPEHDEDLDDDELDPNESSATKGRSLGRRCPADWDQKIREHLRGQSVEELAELICSLTQRFPELRAEFRERIALSEGDVGRLVTQARRELREVTSIQPWRNDWTGEGEIPDYSRLKRRLERLAQSGHADEVVSLGRELMGQGMEQVEQAQDEGDTAMALGDCLPVVFDAVVQSSLSWPEKLLFAIDAHLEDEYNVIGDAADALFDGNHSPADWSVVADALADRLKQAARSAPGRDAADGDAFYCNYIRDQISNWLLEALRRAGRQDELLTIYETEARSTGSYQRLVDHLIAEGKNTEALRWAREGIEKTSRRLPGIAAGLAGSLCELARCRRQWPIVAAHAAWQFFEQPGVQTFNALCDAARKAKCEKPVRQAALRFLETGRCPIRITASRKGRGRTKVDADWPLPVPDELALLLHRAVTSSRPHYDALLDMAIADKRPDDVLRWYDCMQDAAKGRGGDWRWQVVEYADCVAAAVAKSHP
ncbi:MAG: hypothetical protein V3U29_06835, partial [Phycisphaeraceae bacterium]